MRSEPRRLSGELPASPAQPSPLAQHGLVTPGIDPTTLPYAVVHREVMLHVTSAQLSSLHANWLVCISQQGVYIQKLVSLSGLPNAIR